MYNLKLICLFVTILCLQSVSFGQEFEVRFTVLDEKGAIFAGLKANDVRMTVDKQVVGVEDLKMDDGPLSLLILVDASASQEKTLPFQKKAAEAFIDVVLRPGRDRAGVAKFSDSYTLVQDLTRDLGEVKAGLDKIRFVPPPGYIGGGISVSIPQDSSKNTASTSLFDALERLIGDFAYSGFSSERKAVLLISDGHVTSGEKRSKDVVRASSRAGIPVYVIGIGDRLFSGVDEGTLKKIASETGGTAIFPKKESKLAELLPRIANPLRSQYVAKVRVADGNDRKLSIDIINPELKGRLHILTRESF